MKKQSFAAAKSILTGSRRMRHACTYVDARTEFKCVPRGRRGSRKSTPGGEAIGEVATAATGKAPIAHSGYGVYGRADLMTARMAWPTQAIRALKLSKLAAGSARGSSSLRCCMAEEQGVGHK
jgi:hypothetical protein